MPFPERGQFDCYYCKLHHKDVEAGGVYYCPNAACRGPGVWWFNKSLASFKENDRGYEVDPSEADAAALVYADTLTDEPLAAHIRACVAGREIQEKKEP